MRRILGTIGAKLAIIAVAAIVAASTSTEPCGPCGSDGGTGTELLLDVMVTAEPDGGSPEPTSNPVLSASLT